MAPIQTQQKDNIHIIKLPETVDNVTAKQLEIQFQGWANLPSQIHLLDCSDVQNIDTAFYRPLSLFQKALKDAGKQLTSAKLNPKILKQVTADGMVSVFNPIKPKT
ncbi:MAG: STAS domain-containing protein [Xanthomonadaceae bacterium]|nr:STAS domain-containing protein [Xanthomonadaceae bacterium]